MKKKRSSLKARLITCSQCGIPHESNRAVGATRLSPGVAVVLCENCRPEEVLDLLPPDWTAQSRCLNKDPDSTTPETWAKTYCAYCPVIEACAKYAWDVDGWTEQTGPYRKTSRRTRYMYYTFAALTPKQRKSIQSREEMVFRAKQAVRAFWNRTDKMLKKQALSASSPEAIHHMRVLLESELARRKKVKL